MKNRDWVEQAPQAKPPNHGTYQVWHEGKIHAVDVEGTNLWDVERLTKRRPEKWADDPAVTLRVEHPRSTRVGDVIVDPTCGAWEVRRDAYLAVEPPTPVRERMEREGITPQYISLLRGWTRDMLDAIEAHENAAGKRIESKGREQ